METLRIAVTALRGHKLRSFLTLLGVIIGVMTVIAVVSVISGLNHYVANELFQLNPDVFVVTQFGIITSRDEFLEAIRRKPITVDDLAAVDRLCAGCAEVGGSLRGRMLVKRGEAKLNGAQVIGATANMAELNNLDIEAGRFFTNVEATHGRGVAIIGSDIRDELFGELDPIGRTMQLGGRPLRVVGLLRKQGAILGQNQDDQVFVPLDTYRKQFGTRRSIDLFIRPQGGMAAAEAVQDEVRVILRARRKTPFYAVDPFGLVNAGAIQNAWEGISAGAFALMVFISGISLVVGGIVIMNIMLVSVVQRTREIGVRRALGARKRDIHLQFLTEAVLLALGGGLIGVLLGAGIAKGLSLAFPLPTRVEPVVIFAGLGISLVTGVVAGLVPARKAANLDPVDALRYE